MLFLVNESWKVKSEYVRAFVEKDTSIYGIVELSSNTIFFVLSVAVYVVYEDIDEDDRDVMWRTFLIDSLQGVLFSLSKNDNFIDHELKIYLPSYYSKNDEICVKTVSEIHEGLDQNNNLTHRYKCTDNSVFYDFRRVDEVEFIELRCIYPDLT